ncbi:hypothetical protein G4B88_021023 [Cannabis sativa]|uniref:Uncharacterized protein n=1 Tax=Cannabis sativa TaxID=3483 RepID=A0A7J6HY80_CANSA|nr:hypothetical protein G4B88_021023 [Cannabis sativa]
MPLITNEWQVLFLVSILFQWEPYESIRLHVLFLLLYRELLHVLLDVKQIVDLIRVDLERYERSPSKSYIRLSSNTAFHRILYVPMRSEVKCTLATLRKAEFGFLGVIVEKLTDKPPLLPLYRTVHEIFISYGSSFNSFEVIGSFSSFENLSILPLRSEE